MAIAASSYVVFQIASAVVTFASCHVLIFVSICRNSVHFVIRLPVIVIQQPATFIQLPATVVLLTGTVVQ